METIGARASHMEGAQAERECSAELVERENRYVFLYARIIVKQRPFSLPHVPRFTEGLTTAETEELPYHPLFSVFVPARTDPISVFGVVLNEKLILNLLV